MKGYELNIKGEFVFLRDTLVLLLQPAKNSHYKRGNQDDVIKPSVLLDNCADIWIMLARVPPLNYEAGKLPLVTWCLMNFFELIKFWVVYLCRVLWAFQHIHLTPRLRLNGNKYFPKSGNGSKLVEKFLQILIFRVHCLGDILLNVNFSTAKFFEHPLVNESSLPRLLSDGFRGFFR